MNDAAGSRQSGQNKRGLISKARSCKPSFLAQDCNKTSSRLQQVLRQRIVSNGALWTSEKLFSFTSMMDVTRDRTQREEYSSVKLNIDRFHSVEFFHLQRVSIIIYLTNFKLSQSIIAIILIEKTYIYFYPY